MGHPVFAVLADLFVSNGVWRVYVLEEAVDGELDLVHEGL